MCFCVVCFFYYIYIIYVSKNSGNLVTEPCTLRALTVWGLLPSGNRVASQLPNFIFFKKNRKIFFKFYCDI